MYFDGRLPVSIDPLEAILKHLDAMSAVKMNVLHWHIVDIESFPYQSAAFPELSQHGAYHPTEVYTPADIMKVVAAAKERGIRVIPEIDTPGHVWAGFAAMEPAVLTSCYGADGTVSGTGPLDPTKESTFSFLTTLLAEVAPLFEDKMFMVGGDEVDFGCWASNPDGES
jgi:hexosaminidase